MHPEYFKMKMLSLLGALSATLVILWSIKAVQNPAKSTRAEELLASADNSEHASAYAELLDQIDPNCIEDRIAIAKMTAEFAKSVNQRGGQTTALEQLIWLREEVKVRSESTNEIQCIEIYSRLE